MALHSIGENYNILRSMHGNRGRQQRALYFSMEVNKWFIRACHVSNIKMNIPKQLFSYPRIVRRVECVYLKCVKLILSSI